MDKPLPKSNESPAYRRITTSISLSICSILASWTVISWRAFRSLRSGELEATGRCKPRQERTSSTGFDVRITQRLNRPARGWAAALAARLPIAWQEVQSPGTAAVARHLHPGKLDGRFFVGRIFNPSMNQGLGNPQEGRGLRTSFDAMPFSADYFSARERFRRAAFRLGCRVESTAVRARGPRDEELTVDAALTGDKNAERALVLTSGLHGIEGFFGSAVVCALLEQGLTTTLALRGIRVVLVHALNPFGFSRLRRAGEQNVDLNRNFLLNRPVNEGPPQRTVLPPIPRLAPANDRSSPPPGARRRVGTAR
jgi:hypothetical protein